MVEYLIKTLTSTGLQLLILFGPLLTLGLMMHFVSHLIERFSIRIAGRKVYLYTLAWLGTSVHELGHAIFAVLFGHRIVEMKLFSPDPSTGTLGYVKHSWNRKNLYHVTGNFFIGIGPVILGTLALFLIMMILYGVIAGEGIYVTNLSAGEILDIFILNVNNITKTIFLGSGSAWWKTLILIFVMISIGASVKLSPPDISGAAGGFLMIVILLLILNLVTAWTGGFVTQAATWLTYTLSGFYFLMTLSVIINLIFLLILSLLLLMKNLVSH